MTTRTPVYLDYAATTPVDERVAEEMCECLTRNGCYANPASSSHQPGRDARGRVEQARREVAALIGASPTEIVWTSGATESDNLAIKGAALAHARRGTGLKRIVFCLYFERDDAIYRRHFQELLRSEPDLAEVHQAAGPRSSS